MESQNGNYSISNDEAEWPQLSIAPEPGEAQYAELVSIQGLSTNQQDHLRNIQAFQFLKSNSKDIAAYFT